MNNYIPNETKIFDDQNSAWINADIGDLIIVKNKIHKKISKRYSKLLLQLQILSAARETRKFERFL